MPILREGRVIRDLAFQPQAAEPTIDQIKVNLFAQASFGANTETVPDDQHAYHQLRINRGPARVAIVVSKVRTQCAQIEILIDASQQVILRNALIAIERVKQSILPATLLPCPRHPERRASTTHHTTGA